MQPIRHLRLGAAAQWRCSAAPRHGLWVGMPQAAEHQSVSLPGTDMLLYQAIHLLSWSAHCRPPAAAILATAGALPVAPAEEAAVATAILHNHPAQRRTPIRMRTGVWWGGLTIEMRPLLLSGCSGGVSGCSPEKSPLGRRRWKLPPPEQRKRREGSMQLGSCLATAQGPVRFRGRRPPGASAAAPSRQPFLVLLSLRQSSPVLYPPC